MRAKTPSEREREHADTWQNLQKMMHPAILTAPGLIWSEVDPLFIRFLSKNAVGTPWLNHLALAVIVMTTHARLDRQTIASHMYPLHARWRVLFPAYGLTAFKDWKPLEHIPRYLNDTEIEDSISTRQDFLRRYSGAAHHTHAYLRSLPQPERAHYQQWVLPVFPISLQRQLARGGELFEAQAQRRKRETDAISPHFTRIRSEAHLRWNQLKRLQVEFDEAKSLVLSGQEGLPLMFSYEETSKKQRLHFILWDRPSFVIAHSEQYAKTSLSVARRQRKGIHPPEHHHYFLEFVRAEMLSDASPDSGSDTLLWFEDLLRYDLLAIHAIYGTEEEVKRKQAYLHSWGYEAELGEERCPFRTGNPGLLTWTHSNGDATFFSEARKRTNGLLLQVEPLFAAATFGLAALDFFTTTGARVSESCRSVSLPTASTP